MSFMMCTLEELSRRRNSLSQDTAGDCQLSSELKLENRNWATQLPANVDFAQGSVPCAQCVWLYVKMKPCAWHKADDAVRLTRVTFHPEGFGMEQAGKAEGRRGQLYEIALKMCL